METRTIQGLTINMVNDANLFSVDNHVNEVCNIAFLSLCKLLRQATTGSPFCKNPCEIYRKPNKFHEVKNEYQNQVVLLTVELTQTLQVA